MLHAMHLACVGRSPAIPASPTYSSVIPQPLPVAHHTRDQSQTAPTAARENRGPGQSCAPATHPNAQRNSPPESGNAPADLAATTQASGSAHRHRAPAPCYPDRCRLTPNSHPSDPPRKTVPHATPAYSLAPVETTYHPVQSDNTHSPAAPATSVYLANSSPYRYWCNESPPAMGVVHPDSGSPPLLPVTTCPA